MTYAHKLAMYDDPPHKKVVYCFVCGQDSNLSGPCPGEYVPTPEQQAAIDKQFREIFDTPVVPKPKTGRFSKFDGRWD